MKIVLFKNSLLSRICFAGMPHHRWALSRTLHEKIHEMQLNLFTKFSRKACSAVRVRFHPCQSETSISHEV